jgi:hypothetical protein
MTRISSFFAPVALAVASLSVAASPALAETQSATAGKPLFSADGKRVGAVYKVASDGSLQLIVNGKMVVVPAGTVTVADGKITTSLTKKELASRR